MTRGHLRIYLGAAPGVGKTFAMLNEGRRRHDRGTDVVVGYVETHGRPNTAAQLAGLEVMPRRQIEHRGRTFEEMDIDALLAQRPAVVLVDELAHTNVPGSRNEKRWQDVQELLDVGIEVISTVNIQHLESVNDVVERITGVKQRETVPDEVVREADQVELVDMSPEALRRRMAHGNIYGAEKVDAALGNYFRVGNLAALRELALLWVADKVDDALHDYMVDHDIDHVWETRERVVVAMTGAPSGEHLIRRAARMAQRGHGDLVGVHIRSSDGLASDAPVLLDRHRTLLADLGGQYHEVVGTDIGETMLGFARRENATQLVLGASRRSRWSELVRGSVINKVIRAAGEIDVHVISDLEAEPEELELLPRLPRSRRRARLAPRREAAGWALAAVGIPLLTLLLAQFRADLNLPSDMLLYLLLVCGVAAVGGWRPAVTAAVVASLTVNYYFTPPQYTFTISELENTLALIVFLAVAMLLSVFVTQASSRQRDAQRARAEAQALARIAGGLAGEEEPVPEMLGQIRSTFDLDSATVFSQTDDGWRVEAAVGHPIPATPDGGEVVRLGDHSVLVVVPAGLAAEDRNVLDAFAGQLATALEQRLLRAKAAEAETRAEADHLRTAILRAVSHDLRTPLASIKASSTSLLAEDITWSPAQQRDFVETIDEEADRLDRLVGNLLDMSRIESGAVAVASRSVGLEEVVGLALASLGDPSGRVDVVVPVELPPVLADAALLERVVANLVRNALLHGPSAHEVRVEGAVLGEEGVLRVVDRGPGIPPDQRELVFGPFQRLGDGSSTIGVGLGLAVAKGFVEAMDGRIELDDTPGGGLTVTVALPLAPTGRTRRDDRVRHDTVRHDGGDGPPMTRVLVVDDEPQIRGALATNLRARDYEVDLAASGEEALRLAADQHPDVVILDLGLPGIDGVEVVRGLRGWSTVPIVVLSVREDERDKIEALDAGADDYVTKPFGMNELLARLRAALRRVTPVEEEATVTTTAFAIDLAAKKVLRDGVEVRLTPIEWALVEQLVRHPGRLVSQRQLLQAVWGPAYETESNYLRVHLAAVRKKLEPEPSQPRYFITEPGMGYRFEPDPA